MKKLLVNIVVFTSAAILAETCTEGDIRLVGSVRTNDHEGRVELCHNNVWGTVCDDHWDSNEGRVVCRQLGLTFVDVVYSAYFGRGTGWILLDDLFCSGSETRLIDCRHGGFGVHGCGHHEDAGVICEADLQPVITNCTEGEIRLVNGPDNFEGRVEICHNKEWGTVCDNSWSPNDGIVACHQLGLSYVSVTTNAYYGQGRRQIWLENLSCTGSESQLFDCTHNGYGSHDCGHHEDAGLVCNNETSCVEGDVRLVESADNYGDLVEICHLNVWGSICGDSWNRNDGIVACHQLGLAFLTISKHNYFHGQGSGKIWLSSVQCSGSETVLTNCTHSGFDSYRCSQVAGLRCDNTSATDAVHAPLRLTHGDNQFEGIVEVYYDGQWGIVCDDNWDIVDASVVCHQLGYNDAIEAYVQRFRSSTIWLDEIQCTTGDQYLSECSHDGWGNVNCGLSNTAAAAVSCNGSNESCTEGDIRLAHGNHNLEGRVEVCNNSEWVTVCDSPWRRNEGIVACRQLGLPYVAVTTNSFHGPGTGQVWGNVISCEGSESRLIDCPYSRRFRLYSCNHYNDAGVICGNYSRLRLGDGNSSYAHGTLMFQLADGTWGTVCKHGFDYKAARIACRQLGYYYGYFSTCGEENHPCQHSNASFAVCYTGCSTNIPYLGSCYIGQDCSTCSHSDDIRLSCYNYRYYYYDYYEDDDYLSFGAIIGISIASVLSFIIIIILLVVACVCTRRHYVKRKVRTYGVTNQDVIADETGYIVSSDSLQPQSTAVSYNQLAEDCTIKTMTSQSCDAASEPTPEYTPTKPPPAAPNDGLTATPTTKDVVQ
ncbi:scavenger receptor cysteine-rich domain-containing group B protein-like isoform X2 [Dysidea avara]|uniref:scavenger receptor cysteine-rich domain-containing group B protein-like isoform X2 n=1 Tax=Dysidea avara TaxID=196820 RepID=UPI00332F846D